MTALLAMAAVLIGQALEPLPSDVERFPPQSVIQNHIDCLRAAREWATRNVEIDLARQAWWLQVMREVDRADDCWRRLSRARDCYESSPVYAIEHLRELREMLGERNYYSARMPGLPVWAYREKSF